MLRPTAIEVTVMDDYKLLIKFDNGEIKLFDGTSLFSRIPFYSLKNQSIFKTVRTNGISIEWNNDIDICPDELYDNSIPFSQEKNIN